MTRGGEKGPYALACTPRAGSMYLLHAGDGVQAAAAKRIESVEAVVKSVAFFSSNARGDGAGLSTHLYPIGT